MQAHGAAKSSDITKHMKSARWQALAHKLENAVQWIGRETYTTVTTVTTITTTKKTTTTWELLYILKAAEVNAQEAGTHTHTRRQSTERHNQKNLYLSVLML